MRLFANSVTYKGCRYSNGAVSTLRNHKFHDFRAFLILSGWGLCSYMVLETTLDTPLLPIQSSDTLYNTIYVKSVEACLWVPSNFTTNKQTDNYHSCMFTKVLWQ